ncbi:MAG: hypothetical protein F4Z18_10595 [Caldilineaceae bacterium SB0666_bin_21]|nr:hypothetical protein [Caldilineaceae bacterium SB0666_bin_21]
MVTYYYYPTSDELWAACQSFHAMLFAQYRWGIISERRFHELSSREINRVIELDNQMAVLRSPTH